MKTKEFNFKKLKWDCIQVIVDYDTSDDEYETSVNYFSSRELENEYFIELLQYLISHGGTRYKDYFDEFMCIPKCEDGKPKVILNATIIKFDDGAVFSI